MSFARQTLNMRASFRPFLRPSAPRTTLAPRLVRLAHGDYGSGAGDPVGENPQEQGKSQKTRSQEHPGPSAPNVGSKEKSSSASSSPSSSNSSSTPSSSGDSDKVDQRSDKANKEVGGKKPKILTDEVTPEQRQSEEVREHNEDVERRKKNLGWKE